MNGWTDVYRILHLAIPNKRTNRAKKRSVRLVKRVLIATIDADDTTSRAQPLPSYPDPPQPAASASAPPCCSLWGPCSPSAPPSALADAGNPIIGTTKGDLVQNPDGTVTVYVRGQWNWLSHNSDCNFDRAATGLAMIWNDPTETGYTLTKGTVSAAGRRRDQGRQLGRPQPDRRHGPPGRPRQHPRRPAGAAPNRPSTTPTPAGRRRSRTRPTTWRGGCGREPLNHADAYTGHPWGSWGYEKSSLGTDGNIHLGYSHVYRSRDFVPKSVCVNFYDVHGGGEDQQRQTSRCPTSSDNIDVLANGDNSIETNAFNVNGGSCVHFAKITTKAIASVKLGEPIPDTATITDAFTNGTAATDGTVTFKAYKDPTTCTGAADFTSGPTAGRPRRQHRSHLRTLHAADRRHLLLGRHLPQHRRPAGDRHLDHLQRGGGDLGGRPARAPRMLVTDSTNGNSNGNIHIVGATDPRHRDALGDRQQHLHRRP